MITLDEIRRPIREQLTDFEAFVGRQFTAEGELLSEMLRYALSSRGKGIRPMLVFLSAALHAGTIDKVGRRTQIAALLVEMIHVASLIHDDVIDEADQRRGRPSPNALWQSHNAVVLGDYILARNLDIGLESGQFDLVSHITRSVTTLCEGEILQSDSARHQVISRERYFDIIRRKTASLIGTSASAGALSVGAAREQVERMHRFGEAIGMAFQIQDDILDYSPAAHTGKPANNDLKEGKITLPLLAVLEHSDRERQRELLDLLAACHTDRQAVAELQGVAERCGGIEEAARTMEDFIGDALRLLEEYPASPCRNALELLARYVAQRRE